MGSKQGESEFHYSDKITEVRIKQISRENRLSNAKQAAFDVALTNFNLCCKYCNLAFMHSRLFNVFAPFVVPFSIFAA